MRTDDGDGRLVDGLGRVIHERLFAVEITGSEHCSDPREKGGSRATALEGWNAAPSRCKQVEPSILGNLTPAPVPTNLPSEPVLQEPIEDPARFPWHEVTKVAHYWLEVNALTKPCRCGSPRRHTDGIDDHQGGIPSPTLLWERARVSAHCAMR